MTDTRPFGLLVLLIGAVALAAVLANRLSDRIRVPLPAVFLAAAAIARLVLPALHAPDPRTLQRVVTLALLMILFDGGLHLGRTRFRAAAAPIVVAGVLGTFATTAAAAAVSHWAFGFSWYLSVLLATAVAPTDPAVVFSVLGPRQIDSRASTILEGESGANDPVGIALLASLITAGGLGGGAFLRVGAEFVLQLVVGAAVGIAGGRLLLALLRRVSLPSDALYPLLSLAWVLILYGTAAVADGSGFLAVFVAGIVLSDESAPFKREVERFHSALGSLGEIVAFLLLGLTVDLHQLGHSDVWVAGLALGLVLAVVIRPVLVGLLLLPTDLARNERGFVLFAGLKGAVPILLGNVVLHAGFIQGPRLYGIVVVVVIFSVVVQGSLVATVASALGLPTRMVAPTPWALGVRLAQQPDGVHRLQVMAGSAAAGQTLAQLSSLPTQAWVSLVVRDLALVPATPSTELRAGDEVLVLAPAAATAMLMQLFGNS